MRLKYLTATMTLLLLLLTASNAFPEDDKIGGQLGATGAIINVSGNKAKFSEYRDMVRGGGLYSDVRLGYESDNYFVRLKALDFSYDTQNYQLDGGMYGKFKYGLSYNEIIHNITFGALTPYSGAGSNTLTYSGAAPSRNPSTWNSFDYFIKRKTLGGDIKFDMFKPFYIDLSASNERRNGVLPVGAGTGMNVPAAFIELPAPVQYTTNIVRGEFGYSARPVFAAVNYLYSNFDDDNRTLDFESILSTKMDSTTLPPNNHYYRVGFKGSVQLPLNSRFSVNLANARSKSDFDLLTSYLLTGTTVVNLTSAPNSLSSTVFKGRKDIENYDLSLASNPVPFLDGRIFYKYYNVQNKSDVLTAVDVNNTTTASAPGFVFTNELFDYRRNTFGVDLGFRLPSRFHLDTAYKYVDVHRKRGDALKTIDNIYSADLRWSGLDYIMPKIGYERLQRVAAGPTEDALSDNFGVDQFLRRFDAAKQHRDTYKAAVDAFPMDNLNFGAAFKYKKSIYPDSILGMNNSRTNEFDIYGDYLIGNVVKLNAYFDLQDIKTNSSFRYFNSVSKDANPNDPPLIQASGAPPTNSYTAYNWNMTIKDRTYNYGAGADLYLIPKKLMVRVQYDYVYSNGFDDLTYLGVEPNAPVPAPASATNPFLLNAAANNGNIDIPNFDDYRKSAFLGKLVCQFTKAFSLAAGVVLERYRYHDTSFDNYQNFFTNTAGTPYFLSGAYANPSYNASIGFVSVAYKF